MMRNFLKTGFYALITMLAFASCDDDDAIMPSLKVKVTMPDGFTTAYTGEVTLSGQDQGKSYKAKAVNGVAEFASVYPGIYDVQAHQSMTREEAQKAAPGLEISNGILMTGMKKGVSAVLNVETNNANEAEIEMGWSLQSSLLISRVYGNGTQKNNGKPNNMPKYWEIYNNTDETIYLDGLCLAQAHGLTTADNPCLLYQKYQKEATYASRISKLPGTHGKDRNIALEAGKSLVIAWNASNFLIPEDTKEGAADKCTMNVDLSKADYELESTTRPWLMYGDNTNVPNMKPIYECNSFGDFLQMNQALFIFFANEEDIEGWTTAVDDQSYTAASNKKWLAKRVPNNIILDAVETLKKDASQQKRIPDMLDSKGIEAGNNTGSIFDRRILYIAADGRKILQDTNNSSEDFVVVESRNAEAFDGAHLVIRDYDKPEIQPKN